VSARPGDEAREPVRATLRAVAFCLLLGTAVGVSAGLALAQLAGAVLGSPTP
jgi:hypothetical protein